MTFRRTLELLRRHRDAALGITIAAMAAVIVATLHWADDARRLRPMLQCGTTATTEPPADGSEPRYAVYLVRGATPEEICDRVLRPSQSQSPVPR